MLCSFSNAWQEKEQQRLPEADEEAQIALHGDARQYDSAARVALSQRLGYQHKTARLLWRVSS